MWEETRRRFTGEEANHRYLNWNLSIYSQRYVGLMLYATVACRMPIVCAVHVSVRMSMCSFVLAQLSVLTSQTKPHRAESYSKRTAADSVLFHQEEVHQDQLLNPSFLARL